MRTVSRVEDKMRLGPDAQVDDKALIIMPKDPRLTDPFLALAEDWFSEPGFEWHPHRGIETVTTVLDGVLEHGDNLGNAGALEPGDVQWMMAGRGIIHRELAFRNEHAHTLQLWVNLPSRQKLGQTGYRDLRSTSRPMHTSPGVVVDVISSGDAMGSVNRQQVRGALITLEPGSRIDHAIPTSHRAFFYVLEGQARIADRSVRTGQIAWSDPVRDGSATIMMTGQDPDAPTKVMAYSGVPLREPVVMGGPFVMNSRAQIEQAYADFHSGKFGAVPKQPRLRRL
jgi:redox-sensitive bicupin YhaK (pirin superfamily)